MSKARVVITNSGGVQEETTVLGLPCLTVRESTERPATIEYGTNRLVGTDPRAMIEAAPEVLNGHSPQGRLPEPWDGNAARRIVVVIRDSLGRRARGQ